VRASANKRAFSSSLCSGSGSFAADGGQPRNPRRLVAQFMNFDEATFGEKFATFERLNDPKEKCLTSPAPLP
jgi:hypothetical protein